MELIYIYIESFRNIKNLDLTLSDMTILLKTFPLLGTKATLITYIHHTFRI